MKAFFKKQLRLTFFFLSSVGLLYVVAHSIFQYELRLLPATKAPLPKITLEFFTVNDCAICDEKQAMLEDLAKGKENITLHIYPLTYDSTNDAFIGKFDSGKLARKRMYHNTRSKESVFPFVVVHGDQQYTANEIEPHRIASAIAQHYIVPPPFVSVDIRINHEIDRLFVSADKNIWSLEENAITPSMEGQLWLLGTLQKGLVDAPESNIKIIDYAEILPYVWEGRVIQEEVENRLSLPMASFTLVLQRDKGRKALGRIWGIRETQYQH